MFLIVNFGFRTVKSYGSVEKMTCMRCKYMTAREVLKVTSWLTLFYLPIVPYKKQYLLVCPFCNAAYVMNKRDFDMLTNFGRSKSVNYGAIPRQRNTESINRDKYAGKTPTQIEYLRQMEKFERRNGDNNDSRDNLRN